ncbi:hypothetical protein IGI04_030839 [Brassica rapa subsp. trilocularis]|uniref:Uncharacterized protein n=1 Tax=Brassica rapa subsp. trilocularis TaxID=1813537 RepID=A0ABQ7LRW2_BRACM|nr:hypothetical protein IGI04_030839 [Brassica rapa subsp. trilocularis]
MRQTLKNFSEDSQKTLGKSSNTFFARRLSTKSPGSLPKSSIQNGTYFGYTLKRLLGKYSNAFYARRLLGKFSNAFYATKSSGSLLKSSAQSDTNFGYIFCSAFGRLLRRLSELLEDFLESLRKVFRCFLPKVVQKNDVKWSSSLSMLRNDI